MSYYLQSVKNSPKKHHRLMMQPCMQCHWYATTHQIKHGAGKNRKTGFDGGKYKDYFELIWSKSKISVDEWYLKISVSNHINCWKPVSQQISAQYRSLSYCASCYLNIMGCAKGFSAAHEMCSLSSERKPSLMIRAQRHYLEWHDLYLK